MEHQIDISGMDKAEILAALYNGSFQQGMGKLHERGRDSLSKEEAKELLNESSYFDYLHGRIMKIDLKGDKLKTSGYNRDVGEGAAERIIEGLRKS